MTTYPDWHDTNNAYLGAAMSWLRLRLAEIAPPPSSVGEHVDLLPWPIVADRPEPERALAAQSSTVLQRLRAWLLRQLRGDDEPAEPPAQASYSPAVGSHPNPPAPEVTRPTPRDVLAAEKRMRELEGGDHTPALVAIAGMFDLTRFERDVLLLCAAIELDTRSPALCANAQGDSSLAFPTFGLALTAFKGGSWEALGPDGALRRHRLIEIVPGSGRPLTGSPLRADEQIVNAVKGLFHHDERLSPYISGYLQDDGMPIPPSQGQLADVITARLQVLPPEQPVIVHLVGADVESKQLVATNVAARMHLSRFLSRVRLASLPSHPGDLDQLVGLFARESLLLRQAIYVDAFHQADGPQGPEGPMAVLQRFVPRVGGLVFLDTRDVVPTLDVPTITVEVTPPSMTEQAEEWRTVLRLGPRGSVGELIGQFNLSAPMIRRIGAVVRDATPDSATPAELSTKAWRACSAATRPDLDRLAQRIEPRAQWNDLVLPEQARFILRAIIDQVRQRGRVYRDWGMAAWSNRGLGTVALFTGESGTGKTMAAEVLAGELELNLHRIDLSQVVSKYIGETEKNLSQVFDAAAAGGTVLFFDEADALFGKRSEVKDSHDRFANNQTAHLLQRMETYPGLAILATNMRAALDQAFWRRIRFQVEYPFPSPEARREIWLRSFPPGVPVDPLDFDRLARLALTGGSIANVALNSMFMAAASERQRVTMTTVLDAARLEYRKLQLPANDEDFALDAAALDGPPHAVVAV